MSQETQTVAEHYEAVGPPTNEDLPRSWQAARSQSPESEAEQVTETGRAAELERKTPKEKKTGEPEVQPKNQKRPEHPGHVTSSSDRLSRKSGTWQAESARASTTEHSKKQTIGRAPLFLTVGLRREDVLHPSVRKRNT